MIAPRIPAVISHGRSWSADEVEAQAARWRDEAVVHGALTHPLAVLVPSTADAAPLLLGMSSLPTWIALLPADPRAWPSALNLPAGTKLMAPVSTPVDDAAKGLGCEVHVLSAPADHLSVPRTDKVVPFSGHGIVLFTSGSTAASKPVFRSTETLLLGSAARVAALGLESGDGILAGTSLAHGAGLNRLVSATLLGGPFGLLDRLDHRAALAMLARPEFTCWAATAHFADALGRCALTGPPVVPRVCVLGGAIPRAVHDRFLNRFGIPIRQVYSSTETGPVSLDGGEATDVDPSTVGRPLDGVEIRIGDRLEAPLPANDIGRIWVRSPWQMAGYGYPPGTTRPGSVDGWWPTSDLGTLRADGRLVLAGRLDDCLRTSEGRLVNLAAIASVLCGVAGVRDAAVVPLSGVAGATFGALLQCAPDMTVDIVREALTAVLPTWARPRVLVQVETIPRLPGGKVDRRRCAALLEGGHS